MAQNEFGMSIKPRRPIPSRVLPSEAERRLIQASQIEQSGQRLAAIEEAIRWVQRTHPQLFRAAGESWRG